MNKKILFLAVALCVTLSMANAQNFQEGFFLDGYRTSFRFNPALANDVNFLSVGNYTNTKVANIGASSILFPNVKPGSVVTGLNSAVPAETFLSGLKDTNILTGEIDYNFFSFGFARNGAYHTVEANLKNSYRTSIPKDFFAFIKVGSSAEPYDLSGTSLQDHLYAELSYGYSRKIGDIISVGARGKLLVGLNAAMYRMPAMNITAQEDRVLLSGETELGVTDRLFTLNPDTYGNISISEIRRKQTSYLPTGAGLAIDLGVVIVPTEKLTISASILDLGGMLWWYGNAAASAGAVSHEGFGTYDFQDFNIDMLSDKVSALVDNMMSIVELKKADRIKDFVAVPMKANMGVKYQFCNAFSAGIVGNFTNYQGMAYLESRLGIGFTPFNWLSATGNIGYGTFGTVWGAGINLRVYRFRLSACYEHGFGGVVPIYKYALEPCKQVLSLGLTFDLL